jgi:hypothetical protein
MYSAPSEPHTESTPVFRLIGGFPDSSLLCSRNAFLTGVPVYSMFFACL